MLEIFILLLAHVLGVVAAAVPVVLLDLFGPLPAVAAGVLIPAVWVRFLPCTCSEGGLGLATLGVTQILFGVGCLGYGIVRGAGFVWGLAVG